jgi:hypothetical protein
MAKVGKFVIDPKLGAYCQIALDDGKKVLVNHEKSDGGGRMMVTEKKLWGGETFLDLRLDTATGQSALARLTADAPTESARATPIGALVDVLKDCRSLDEVRMRCLALAGPAV